MEDDSSMFDFNDGESENFEPVALKKKAAPKAAAAKPKDGAKKAGKATGKAVAAKPAAAAKKKKRALSDDEDEGSDFEDLAHTPPAAKKTKTTTKKAGGKKKAAASTPLKDLNNLNSDEYDEGESMLLKTARELAKAEGKSASETYQMISPTEHVLKRPDTYVGSIERESRTMWIHDAATDQMVYKSLSFVPGLFKIFDELIVNAADNKVRDPNMDTIKVTLDREKNVISVYNNGKGIPVEIHSEVKIYIPEMIFGHLLTSSNYDDDQKKVTGGRNGYGAKLCNIFATEFTVETADRKKKYKQTWKKNMSKCGTPQIKDAGKNEEFTKVTFKPELERFGMEELDDDFESLVRRRIYDIAGVMKNLKVFFNGDRIKVKSFKDYMQMHVAAIQRSIKGEEEVDVKASDIIYEQVNDRWEVGFAISDGSFQQVSFVNSIATTQGGTHVQHVSDMIARKLMESFKKNKGPQLKPNQIKNHFFLFINCLIENPAFNSQTKEQLTTRPSAFGSQCTLSDAFLNKVKKTDILNSMHEMAQSKADQLLKKTDGSRRARVNNPKLVDANKAGTKDGWQCTLILTEGDSAKSMAMSGMEVVGRDLFGVFPLRGKLLNVRDASHDQIANNAEIQNIKQILGLQHKKNYETTKDLRYGHLMIMTDQDHDGSHIKGLLINFLEAQFPSLLKIPGFLIEFITPIVKVYKGTILKPTKVKSFFTMPEYEYWKENNTEKGWQHKYYKGLGTSSNVEARQYFADLDKHLKEFHAMEQDDRKLIDMVFSKKKAEERKEWLRLFKPGTYLDHSIDKISYDDFINKELILFSMADNIRSIPSVVDGLKPGQRKVLFACFKRNLKKDTKVNQLAGYVSEHTAYQHGEQSLAMTITALAQNFVGSNNVNLLEPVGNFGSRLGGGKDASSPRYIATMLSPLARALFPASDDALLDYNLDDGTRIEPMWYCPILPLVLLNGSDGIGTGWSSFIPNYNPADVLNNIRHLMKDEELEPMTPWYRGFTGPVERVGPDKYLFSGKISQINETKVEITELPVRVWTSEYKEKLDHIIKPPDKKDDKKDKKDKKDKEEKTWIKDYLDYNSDLRVHFIVEMENKACMDAALKEGLENRFKLTKTLSLTNMVAFDPQGRIMKYESVEDILKEFYFVRLKLYQDRKEWMLGELNKQLRKLSNQARFVQMIIKKELVVSNKKRIALISELQKLKFDVMSNKKEAEKAGETEPVVDEEEQEEQEDGDVGDGYNYLLGMAIWSLTKEKVDKLLGECRAKELEIDELVKKSPKDLWNIDLDAFEEEWYRQLEEEKRRNSSKSAVKKTRKLKIGAGRAAKKLIDSDEDDDFVVSKGKKKAAAKPAAKPAAKVLKQTTLFSKVTKDEKPRIEELDDDEDESIAPRNVAPRRAAAAASKKVVDLSDSEEDDDLEDFEKMDKPSAATKKSAAAKIIDLGDDDNSSAVGKSKKSGASSIKSEPEDSHGESDDDPFDIAALVKGKTTTSGTSSAFSKKAITSQAKKAGPPAKKPATVSKFAKDEPLDLSDDEDESVIAPSKRAADKKAAAAPKPAAKVYDDSFDMDLDDSDDEPVKPTAMKALASKAKPSTTRTAKPAKKVIDSDEEDEVDEDENNDDEEEEDEEEVVKPAAKARAKPAAKPAAKGSSKDPLELDSILTDSPSKTPKKEMMAKKPVVKPAAKPAAAPAARGRPGRAASKPVKYADSDEDEDEESEAVSLEGDSDDFDDDSD